MERRNVSVSVVIPAFRARNYLECAILSALNQTWSVCEVIVVDDASPEPIDDIIEKFSMNSQNVDVKIIRHLHNKGLGGTRNTGINAAKGEWIAFLDHDDYWEPVHIESLLRLLVDQNADLAFSTSLLFHDNRNDVVVSKSGPRQKFKDIPDLSSALYSDSFICPSSVLVRKSTLLKIQGFSTDPRVHMCEDLDLWIRLLKSGAKFVHSDKETTWYRKHPDSATLRKSYMSRQCIYVREIHYNNVGGAKNEKLATLISTAWRTARQLATEREPDMFKYFIKAGRINLRDPKSLPCNLFKWIFSLTRIKNIDPVEKK